MICQAAIARCKRMHLGRWQSLSQSPLVTLGLWKRRMDLARSETSSRGAQKCVTVRLCGRFLSQRPEQVGNTKALQCFVLFFPELNRFESEDYKDCFILINIFFFLNQIFIRQNHLQAGESGRMCDPKQTFHFEKLFALLLSLRCRHCLESPFPSNTTKYKRVQLYRLRQISFFFFSLWR